MPFKPKVHLGILEHFSESTFEIRTSDYVSFENAAAIAVDCPIRYTWTPSQAAHRPRFLSIHVTLY